MTTMHSLGVLMPLIHEHVMIPRNDERKGDCCGRFEATSDGYHCRSCDFFVHKKCGDEFSNSFKNSSHSTHTLQLISKPDQFVCCNLCAKHIDDLFYHCEICDMDMHPYCAKNPPPDVIDTPETTHHHKLILFKKKNHRRYDCAKCGKFGYEFPYKCHECDLDFHLDCVWHHRPEAKHTLEINYSHHSLHTLKLLTGQPPNYSDGKCRLCGRKTDDRSFYHCSSCDFTLDLHCALNPPQQSLLELKAHDHQLTLLPRLDSFTCNACGLKGDRSPYACFQCAFIIHQECLDLPRVININRHEHRVHRTSLLGVVDSVCGVCRVKVDWTWGGYSCKLCPEYVVHSRCATRKDVWNGKELQGVPEETEDIDPYVVIDDNIIQHFSHKEHHLRLHVNGAVLCEDHKKRCRACTHPVSPESSFYSCMDCDFNLHEKCAELPRRRRHVLHNERLTLVTSDDNIEMCYACKRESNGFRYQHAGKKIDVLCGSILEPFVHQSHPDHPLYYTSPVRDKVCNGCNMRRYTMLRCIENGCEYFVCFGCATLPQVVKHRVDDHPLSLCKGEKAMGIYWCDICEKEMDPKIWFYTCKDHRLSLHTECVLGDLFRLMPGSKIETWVDDVSFEVMLNNSVSRPFCWECKSRCMQPIMLKMLGRSEKYYCSYYCAQYLLMQRKTIEWSEDNR